MWLKIIHPMCLLCLDIYKVKTPLKQNWSSKSSSTSRNMVGKRCGVFVLYTSELDFFEWQVNIGCQKHWCFFGLEASEWHTTYIIITATCCILIRHSYYFYMYMYTKNYTCMYIFLFSCFDCFITMVSSVQS